jgi:ParB-like chromosome segregation protein Spo0J
MKQYKQVTRSVDDLIPYVNNSRTHSDEQIAQVASSIKEFGFTNPILIDDNNGIIAGHGRLLASKKLKLDEVPCIILDGLSDAQRKAYIIADNKLALNSGWDIDKLHIELELLNDDDFDLLLTGFDEQELAKLFDQDDEVELVEQTYAETFSIIIDCEDEEEQEKIFNRLDQEGYKCRVQSL